MPALFYIVVLLGLRGAEVGFRSKDMSRSSQTCMRKHILKPDRRHKNPSA